MMTLTDIMCQLVENTKETNEEIARHERRMDALNAERQRLRAAKEMHQAGLDVARVMHGLEIVQISGQYENAGDCRGSLLDDAVTELATNGGGRLFSTYFGSKSYDRWHGQREDHSYGRCPRHGSIIFSIGLTATVRRRDPQELSETEIEDALYVLLNIKELQKAQRTGKAA